MVEYEFRLRFNLAPATNINSDAETIELLSLPTGEHIKLCTGRKGTPIRDHERLSLLGGPYPSIEQAQINAEKAKSTLLRWAVEHRLGIDFGDGHPRSVITEDGLEALQKQYGCVLRSDVLGIDVYELIPDLRFAMMDVVVQLGKTPTGLVEMFGRGFTDGLQLTAKQLLAFEIYSGSFFDVSPRSRFITLVTAAEALLDPASRPQAVQALVESMELLTKRSKIDDAMKQSIMSSLQWLKAESIGQAGRSLAARLLPHKIYSGRLAPAFFKYCYDIRSQLVHRGRTESSVNMLSLANAMQEFIGDLLLASTKEVAK